MRGLRCTFVVAIVLVCSTVAKSGEPQVMGANSSHQLLLDRRVIQDVQNAELRLGSVQKDRGNPLLPADLPWENATNNLYPNVQWDADLKRYRLWYKCVVHDKEAIARMHQPQTVHEQGWYLLYAESADGTDWKKPRRKDFLFDGQPTNAVAQDTPNVGVFRDSHERDPAKRYKMIFDTGLGQLKVRFSPDGLTWSAPQATTGFGAYHGDTHSNAFWDERLQKYVLFTKHYLGERLVARFESRNFIDWTGTGLALRSEADEGKSVQTYCLAAFPYGNIWLGYVMLYRVGQDRSVDCELAWSADSITWQRVKPQQAFIPRGAKGQGDSACIYAQAGPAILHDGRLQIYYGGSATPHVGWKRHCLLSRATLRRDGFAGYSPIDAKQSAVVVTQPLLVTHKTLRLCVDGGQTRVLVLGDDDFGSEVSEPLTADGEVTWKNKTFAQLVGKTVRFKFVLDQATLYSLEGAEQQPLVVSETGVRRFTDRLTVALRAVPVAGRSTADVAIHYSMDGSAPTTKSSRYTKPFELTANTRLRARAFVGLGGGALFDEEFMQIDPRTTTIPPPGRRGVSFVEAFNIDQARWKGIDETEWIAPLKGETSGALRVRRKAPQVPFAQLAFVRPAPPDRPRVMSELRGDWTASFGSPAVRLTWRMKADKAGGRSRIEIFAADGGAWFLELSPPLSERWQSYETVIRLDWTDDEAKAAGWQRTTAAFSWRDTFKHVTRLVLSPTVQGQPTLVDITDVCLESAWFTAER